MGHPRAPLVLEQSRRTSFRYDQQHKVQRFAELHRGDTPLTFCSGWDTGSAKATAAAGAQAIATISWFVGVSNAADMIVN